jgi:hypothetical protein
MVTFAYPAIQSIRAAQTKIDVRFRSPIFCFYWISLLG